MRIRRESLPWVGGAGLPALLCYGAWLYTQSLGWLAGFVGFAGLTVFLVYFFRDPNRTPESEDPREWLAPADGVVTQVQPLEDGRTQLVIFLTVFNVHVNRMPVSGSVRAIDYRPGRFLPAFMGELEERNEQNRIRCEDSWGRPFELRQIAGLLARRIHCNLGRGDSFRRGDRFGMIALGSRTDLILPPGVEPAVERRRTVRGGRTVVARG